MGGVGNVFLIILILLAVPTDARVDFDGFGVILGSILRVISFLKCVIFQPIILLIVGCGFGSMLIKFDVYFGVFWNKSVVCNETCEIVKNPCFTKGIQ